MQNERGFTLVEVIIAAAALGIISLGFMKMFTNSYNTEKDLSNRATFREFHEEIRLLLVGSQCGLKDNPSESFKNPIVDITKNTPNEIIELVGPQGQIINNGRQYGKLKVSADDGPSISLAPAVRQGPYTSNLTKNAGGYYILPATANTYIGEIRVHFQSIAGEGPKEFISRHMAQFRVNSANQIEHCQTLPDADLAAQFCNAVEGGNITGAWDNIESKCKLNFNQYNSQANMILDYNDPGESNQLQDIP